MKELLKQEVFCIEKCPIPWPWNFPMMFFSTFQPNFQRKECQLQYCNSVLASHSTQVNKNERISRLFLHRSFSVLGKDLFLVTQEVKHETGSTRLFFRHSKNYIISGWRKNACITPNFLNTEMSLDTFPILRF